MIDFKPLRDNILLKLDNKITEWDCGIVIPDQLQEPAREGTVLAVGPGITEESGDFLPTSTKAGDRVIISSYAGLEVDLDGDTYLVLRENDILAYTND